MRRLLLQSAAASCALAFVAPAAATPPTTTETTLHRSVPGFLPCAGFGVHGEFDIARRTTTFYDQSGTAIRTVQHVHADGILSNPLNGKSLPDSGDFMIVTDLLTGTRIFDGKLRVDTAPGVGVVFKVVGRVGFDPDLFFEAGPHDDLDGNLGALCAYLGA